MKIINLLRTIKSFLMMCNKQKSVLGERKYVKIEQDVNLEKSILSIRKY